MFKNKKKEKKIHLRIPPRRAEINRTTSIVTDREVYVYLHSREVRFVDNRQATGVAEEFSRPATALAPLSTLYLAQLRGVADPQFSKRRTVDHRLPSHQLRQYLLFLVAVPHGHRLGQFIART